MARQFKRILRQAGLPSMRPYDLRHTAATLALEAGVPAKIVSEQLGHATAAFTLDVYAHVLPRLQTEAASKMEALLYPSPHSFPRSTTRKPSQSARFGNRRTEENRGNGMTAG